MVKNMVSNLTLIYCFINVFFSIWKKSLIEHLLKLSYSAAFEVWFKCSVLESTELAFKWWWWKCSSTSTNKKNWS